MIAGADRTQLGPRQVVELPGDGQIPRRVIVEQNMLDGLLVAAADAEGDGMPDLIHEGGDSGAQVVGPQIDTHRLVAAGDIVAHAGRRHLAVVGDDTTHRHRVAQVMVGHQHASHSAGAGGHTCLDLLQGAGINGVAPGCAQQLIWICGHAEKVTCLLFAGNTAVQVDDAPDSAPITAGLTLLQCLRNGTKIH